MESFKAEMVYGREYLDPSKKYGNTKDSDQRGKTYDTHVRDYKTLLFHPLTDAVDEKGIHEYQDSLGIGKYKNTEIYDKNSKVDEVVDSDLTLRNFYEEMHRIDFTRPGHGKLEKNFMERVRTLGYLFDRGDDSPVREMDIVAISNLLMTREHFSAGNCILQAAHGYKEVLSKILSKNFKVRDLLNYWFAGEKAVLDLE